MLKSVQFKNFKVLRDATLPLSRFTLIVGPNGSGKSTALQGLQALTRPPQALVTAGMERNGVTVEIIFHWGQSHKGATTKIFWAPQQKLVIRHLGHTGDIYPGAESLHSVLSRIRIYSLDAKQLPLPVRIQPNIELREDGYGLAGVLDRLKDKDEERFNALNMELGQWLPEFDRIVFDVPTPDHKTFLLRTRKDHYKIPASDLSHGILFSLAILTLAYLPDLAPIVCLEEPDRGIHPRLLRQIQDALYRLSYPENFGEKRDPVQVIATTHSPYFLDLYKDHPEEIVIAQKTQDGAVFERLSEQPHIMEILDDASLGEIWYSGILGGVPAEQ